MSCSLSAGAITVRMPLRWAASAFSFSPPIGSTWPVSVISPVIATSERTGRPDSSDASAVTIATPGARTVLGDRPGGHVDVDVVVGEPVGGQVRAPARRALART